MSVGEFLEDLPEKCPPPDAGRPADGQKFYRLVTGSALTMEHFESKRKQGTLKKFAKVDECVASACSLWDTVARAKICRRNPKSKIAEVTLNRTAGMLKATFSTGHYSWWIAANFDPCAHSAIIDC